MWSLSLLVLSFALLQAILYKLFGKLRNSILTDPDNLHDSIFVCCVSYKDNKWIHDMCSLISSAKYSDRVTIGIVEYIEEGQTSMIEEIPQQFRNKIRIYTTSCTRAKSLKDARETCIANLFRNEKYTLFIRSANMTQDWDEYFISKSKTNFPCVISTELNNSNSNTFASIPIFSNPLQITYKHNAIQKVSYLIKAIIISTDLCFCESQHAEYVLSDETDVGIASVLYQNGIAMYNPGFSIAQRAKHPRGLRQSNRNKISKSVVEKYLVNLGIKDEFLGAHVSSGLTKNADAKECIAKYGSVSQANVQVNSSCSLSN